MKFSVRKIIVVAVFIFGFCAACKEDEVQPDVIISAITPSSGPKATVVTLSGSGFSTNAAANSVTLNGLVCAVTSAQATELTIAIPAKAGTGNIQVQVNGKTGQSAEFTYIKEVTVTTLAGSTEGDGDKFAGPRDVDVDEAGNVYIADYGNQKIKKITPAGLVSTVAGSIPSEGETYSPNLRALRLDKAGNIYVLDYLNAKIKKVTPSGVVTTVFDRADYDHALVGSLIGLEIDIEGSLLLSNGVRIFKLTTDGSFTTFAGSATQGDGDDFYFPQGLAFDKDQNLYVADMWNHKIKRVTPAGIVSTIAGNTVGDGDKFNHPRDVVVDKEGNVYVADTQNHKIKKITPSGSISTIAGDILGDGTNFNTPEGIAIDKDGNLYVADSRNHKIKKITIE